jgi:hypothetical protein
MKKTSILLFILFLRLEYLLKILLLVMIIIIQVLTSLLIILHFFLNKMSL